MKTTIDYLYNVIDKYPNKNAYVDSNRAITFSELDKETKCIAGSIIDRGYNKVPVIIFLEKSIECVCAYLGVVRSGNFSTIMDLTMPEDRILRIIENIDSKLIITDRKHLDIAKRLVENRDIQILLYEDTLVAVVDDKKVYDRERSIKPNDILVIPYTSGTTDVPKAIIIHHGFVNNYADWQVERLPITSDLRCGDLVPMYYTLAIWYITITVIHGITTYLIPQKLIKEPVNLMKYLFDNKISIIIWVPSMLGIISDLGCVDKPYFLDLKLIVCCGEAMPAKYMNDWRKHYKNSKFYCMYTTTECIDNELLFEVKKDYDENMNIPIGKISDSDGILLINENGEIASKGEEAELYFKIYGETYGYYNNSVKTNECFVPNPIENDGAIYFKTGDIVRVNDDGEIEYISRKDSQIKFIGNRINLGEIESNVMLIDKVKRCVALYIEEKKLICLCYAGDISEQEIISIMKNKLPSYMMPKKIVKIDTMPLNLNGKIDRKKIKELF